jgi:hypothetical protein
MEKISIIVSAYNAKKHLHACLSSVLNQTYDNYEVIIINDGSTDTTEEIGNEFVHANDKFTLINIENGGPGKARNKGLDIAQGDYILFLDSDDRLVPGCLETAVKAIKKNNLDIIFFHTRLEYTCASLRNNDVDNYYRYPVETINSPTTAERFYRQCIMSLCQSGFGYPVVVWGYIFARQKYQQQRFTQHIYEDEFFTTMLLLSDQDAKVSCLKNKLHIHTLHLASLTQQPLTQDNIYTMACVATVLIPLINVIENEKTRHCLAINITILILSAINKNDRLLRDAINPMELIFSLVQHTLSEQNQTFTTPLAELIIIVITTIADHYQIRETPEVINIIKMIHQYKN